MTERPLVTPNLDPEDRTSIPTTDGKNLSMPKHLASELGFLEEDQEQVDDPETPPSQERDSSGRRKPRVSVYFGMIPELREKVQAKGLEVEGAPIHQVQDTDQALLITLTTLNGAIAKWEKEVDHVDREKIAEQRDKFVSLVGPNDERAKHLDALIAFSYNFQEAAYLWREKQGAADISNLLGNDALWFFLEDPDVEDNFHNLKGTVANNSFIIGGEYEWENPKDKANETITIKAGDYGAAEKVGHYLRWFTGVGFYDGLGPCKAYAYMPHQVRYFYEYAKDKGWYEEAVTSMFEVTDDGEVFTHPLFPYPTMFHAPNVSHKTWIKLVDQEAGKTPGAPEKPEAEKPPIGSLHWEDIGRLLSRYAKGDFRVKEGLYVYKREDFEAADQGKKKEMYKKAIEVWNNLGANTEAEQRKKNIIQNNLTNDRFMSNPEIIEALTKQGALSLHALGQYAKFAVFPMIDLDRKTNDGSWAISLSDMLRAKVDSAWLNNFYVYDMRYAYSSEQLQESIADGSVQAQSGIFETIIKAGSPREYGRHWYGRQNKETGEREGLLIRYIEETGWLMESRSPLFYQSDYTSRTKGERLELAARANTEVRLGLFKELYRREFDDVGLEGHDWTNLYENPLSPGQAIAKVLGKFGYKDAWVTFVDDALKDTVFEKLTADQKFVALLAYAGLKISDTQEGGLEGKPELREAMEYGKKIVQPGRVVNHFDFDVDREGQWGWAYLSELTLDGKPIEKDDFFKFFHNVITREGSFNRFYEKQDEERIVYSLIDRHLDIKLVPQLKKEKDRQQVKGSDRSWGLSYSPLKREIVVNQVLRDHLRYTIGRNRRRPVIEQLETVESRIYGADQLDTVKDRTKLQPHFIVPNQQETVFQTVTINGRRVTLKAKNVFLREKEAPGIEGTKSLQPVIPFFAQGVSTRRTGADPVWTLMQGTGELFPGMEDRLGPLFIHYQRDRYMHFFSAMYLDPLFRQLIGQNTGVAWEEGRDYLFVATPEKTKLIVDQVEALEGDADWAEKWRVRLNVHNPDALKRFEKEKEDLRVVNAETRKSPETSSEQDIVELKNLVVGGYKLADPTGMLAGLAGKLLGGKTWKEVRKRVIAMGPGITAIGLPLALQGGFSLISPVPIVPVLSTIITLAGGIGSSAVLAGDSGIDSQGYEKDTYLRGLLGSAKSAWRTATVFGVSLGMSGERINKRSFHEINTGERAVWDDIIPADSVRKIMEESRKALQHHSPKTT